MSRRDRTADPIGPKLSEHPRAIRSIRRSKSLVALVAFVVAGLLALQAGVPAVDAAVRALACGAVAYVATWAVAIAVWTQVARAEIDAHAEPAER